MKTYSLDELTDKYIGKRGTIKRDEFETILKVFKALDSKINFKVEINKGKLASQTMPNDYIDP